MWKAIPGFEGHYEASTQGEIRSVDRVVPCGRSMRHTAGRVLSPRIHKNGYASVNLSVGGRAKNHTVHKLVTLTYYGSPGEGHEVRHLDGNPLNNALHNLAYGTRAENMIDAKRHGRRSNAVRPDPTKCGKGLHEWQAANIYTDPKGRQVCRPCKLTYHRQYARLKA